MSKKNITQQKKKLHQNLVHKLPYLLVVLALVATAVIQGIRISELERQNEARGSEQVAQALLQSVNDLNQPLPTEPSTGTVYLSAQRLTLPSTPSSLGQLVYSTAYTDDNGTFPVHIAAKNDITQASQTLMSSQYDSQKVFTALSSVQACGRGVGVSYTKTDQPSAEKKLANGKTLYFYTEALCKNPTLLDYLKQIDSY